MLVREVAALFRDYCDEPDTTFLTAANAADYLRLGYSKFRDIIVAADPNFYAISADFTLAGNVDEFDLGPAGAAPTFKLMGQDDIVLPSRLTGPRLAQIINLVRLDGNNDRLWYLRPVGNLQQLDQLSNDNQRFALVNTTLHFTYKTNATYRLWYVPADDFMAGVAGNTGVDWATGVIATNDVYIDNLHPYHDLIALLAYKQYAMRDGMMSPVVQQQIVERTNALKHYITEGINLGSNQVVHVQTETWF
tara:strand:+ start:3898 stop:4644 length:747 start_codon:yes stop_codon:yes gene_type:complete